MRRGTVATWAVGVVSLIAGVGCAPLVRNEPLHTYDPTTGHRFDALAPGDGNSDSVFVCLTFSGGGMRAAALAYGVLHALHDTPLPGMRGDGAPRRILDEVDVISAVSGGSFTALAYGLWGDAVFDGRFEQRFLRHDIKWELATSMLHPRNFFRLGSVALDRIDVAGTYYDEQIFERAKYGRLLERNRRPFIVINATNLALGQRFEFTQDDFDLLGSDLASVPLGWAAAASSAFPILFSPLRMKYFPGPCCSGALARALTSESAERNDRRRYHWAKSLVRTSGPGAGSYALNEDEHRFLYLMDGGLADNLGLSYVIDNFRHGVIRDRINAGRIEKLVVIVVDAGVRPPEDIEQRESSPGIWTVGYKTAATGIDNFSGALSDMLRLLLLDTPAEHRALCERFQNELNACCSQPAMLDAGHDFTSYVIEVSLQNIPDEAARQRFAQIPTSFALPNADVDALIRMGRALLGDGAQFKQLCADLNVHPR